MANPFVTRAAVASDVPALVTLVNSAYRGDSSRAGWTTEADMLGGVRVDSARVQDAITGDGHVVLVHEVNGAIVACVHLERTGDTCYLGMLTTRPTLQGAGVGRGMIAAAERFAVEHWHSREMHMTVLVQRTELVAWYERRGYTVTGERKPFPYGDERFGIPARPDLEFHVLIKRLEA
ncbi:MAG TPA: N-acetyltransferase [Vicinamibacterales bacterium]|nr:N-acetyltransferase [Vicinamibacterales bacterium]